jgi:hypothetical protein
MALNMVSSISNSFAVDTNLSGDDRYGAVYKIDAALGVSFG